MMINRFECFRLKKVGWLMIDENGRAEKEKVLSAELQEMHVI